MTVLRRRSFLELMAATFSARLVAFSPARSMGQAAGGNRSNDASAPAIQPVLNSADRYDFKRILPNGTTTFKVSSRDSHGGFFAMEHRHLKKGGPPRHLHTVEDEWFYVLEGEYLVEIGGKMHRLNAGDSVLGPRGVPHAFAFVGERSGRFLITYAPAGRMEEFFDTRDRQPGGRSTYVNDAEKMRAYGMELTGPPIAVT